MIGLLMAYFAAACGGLIVWGMLRPGRVYEFPFLAGAVFTGFVLIQLVGLMNNPFLPPGALEKTTFMSLLCAGMTYFGYVSCKRPMAAFAWTYDETRLLQVSAVLSAFGAYFFFKLSHLTKELIPASQMWTGLPVVYLFLSKVLSYGFFIAVLIYFHNRSRLALVIILFCSAFYFDRIVVAGRRAETAEYILTIALALWFRKGWSIPRPLMLVGLVLGTLVVISIGDYRNISTDDERGGGRWNDVANIDFLGNIERTFTEGGAELEAAVYYIEAVDRTASFDFGLQHWNQLVYTYVPAQLLGSSFKESLGISLGVDPAYAEFFFIPSMGSTLTGMTDAFMSYWYFGCLKFFLIAFLVRKIYMAAMAGNLTAQILFIATIVPALHIVTHSTQNFFNAFVHISIFLLPSLAYAIDRTGGAAAMGGVSARR